MQEEPSSRRGQERAGGRGKEEEEKLAGETSGGAQKGEGARDTFMLKLRRAGVQEKELSHGCGGV